MLRFRWLTSLKLAARENAEVYPNVTFTLPRGAKLELQGEPGTKMEELFVHGDSEDDAETSRQGMLNNMAVGLCDFPPVLAAP